MKNYLRKIFKQLQDINDSSIEVDIGGCLKTPPYKTSTNRKRDLGNYDAYAMCMNFNETGYLETTIVVTRGQKKFEKL